MPVPRRTLPRMSVAGKLNPHTVEQTLREPKSSAMLRAGHPSVEQAYITEVSTRRFEHHRNVAVWQRRETKYRATKRY